MTEPASALSPIDLSMALGAAIVVLGNAILVGLQIIRDKVNQGHMKEVEELRQKHERVTEEERLFRDKRIHAFSKVVEVINRQGGGERIGDIVFFQTCAEAFLLIEDRKQVKSIISFQNDCGSFFVLQDRYFREEHVEDPLSLTTDEFREFTHRHSDLEEVQKRIIRNGFEIIEFLHKSIHSN